MSRTNKTEQHKKAMLDALEKTLGVVTNACKISKVSRTQHYEWVKEDADYKNAVESIEGVAIDFAESQLHTAIKIGDTTAIIFFLKTKGKRRGYVEKQEIEQTGTQKIEFVDTVVTKKI